MASYYSDKQLETIKKRVFRGLELTTRQKGSVMTEIAQVAFSAYSLVRRFNVEGDLDDLLVAVRNLKGCKDNKYFISFARSLYHWMEQNFADLPEYRMKEAGNKQLEVKVREEIKRLEKERQLQLSLAKKQRAEREREYTRTKRKKAAAKRAKKAQQRRTREERIVRERFDRLHPFKVTHKIRLKPKKEQEAYLDRCVQVNHFCYNWAIDQWQLSRARGERVFADELLKRFNEIKYTEFPELQEVTHFAVSTAFRNFRRATNKFFNSIENGDRPTPPRMKEADDKCGSVFYVANWLDKAISDNNPDQPDSPKNPKRPYLRFPGIGYIKMTEPLRFSGRISSVTVKRESDGHWYACIRININRDEWISKHNKALLRTPPVGIDLGVKNYATMSNGIVIENPCIYKRSLKRKKALNRKISRCQHPRNEVETAKGVQKSNNFRKASMRYARFLSRQAHRRNDFMHKVTSALAYNNRNVAVETLNVEQMKRQHRLSGYLADIMPYKFRKVLGQKMSMMKGNLVEADKTFESTNTCSVCGYINQQKLTLKERTFVCEHCGHTADRDLNAAINLKKLVGLGEPEYKPAEPRPFLRVLQRNGIKAHVIETGSQ